jgi:IS30 family transposase
VSSRNEDSLTLAEREDIPGHWEGDLLRGARNSHVATLGIDEPQAIPLTWDRGLEMAQHKS